MKLPVAQEVAALQRLTTRQLRAKFAELCDETTPSSNRTWLIKRLAWRLQALAEGDLSQRARHRAAELVHDANLQMLDLAAERVTEHDQLDQGHDHGDDDEGRTAAKAPEVAFDDGEDSVHNSFSFDGA